MRLIDADARDVVGFEEYYQVSRDGKVFAKERKVNRKNGFAIRKPKQLKPGIVGKGYLAIDLHGKNGTVKKYVHRMVAEALWPKKDLALTWEDMKKIHHIAEHLKEYLDADIIVPFGANQEAFYTEVLRRFNEMKGVKVE